MIRVDEPHIIWAIVRSLGQPDIDLIDHFIVGLFISGSVCLSKQTPRLAAGDSKVL